MGTTGSGVVDFAAAILTLTADFFLNFPAACLVSAVHMGSGFLRLAVFMVPFQGLKPPKSFTIPLPQFCQLTNSRPGRTAGAQYKRRPSKRKLTCLPVGHSVAGFSGRLWLSEIQRPVREQVTRLLG